MATFFFSLAILHLHRCNEIAVANNSWFNEENTWSYQNNTWQALTPLFSDYAALILTDVNFVNPSAYFEVEWKYAVDFKHRTQDWASIMIFNGASRTRCEGYWIGITYWSDGIYYVQIDRFSDFMWTMKLTESVISYSNMALQIMTIQVTNGNQFVIKIDGSAVLTYSDNDVSLSFLGDGSNSGYIGFEADKDIDIYVYSLTVSGTKESAPQLNTENCVPVSAVSLLTETSLWTVEYGTWEYYSNDRYWYASGEESELITTDVDFYNPNGVVTIDYTFEIDFNGVIDKVSGITIYNSEERTSCKWYFVGVIKYSGGYGLEIRSSGSDSWQAGAWLYEFTENAAHTLTIVITNGDEFEIKLGGDTKLTWTDTGSLWTAMTGSSGYLSLWKESNIETTAYSLHVSGTRTNAATLNLDTCVSATYKPTSATDPPTRNPTPVPITMIPTATPTKVPTLSPTKRPISTSPTENPTASPTKLPTTTSPTKNPATFKPTTAPTSRAPTRAQRASRQPTRNPTTSPNRHSPTRAPTEVSSLPSSTDSTPISSTAAKSASSVESGEGSSDLTIVTTLDKGLSAGSTVNLSPAAASSNSDTTDIITFCISGAICVLMCFLCLCCLKTHRDAKQREPEPLPRKLSGKRVKGSIELESPVSLDREMHMSLDEQRSLSTPLPNALPCSDQQHSAEIKAWLAMQGMSQYFGHFVSNGYETMDIIAEITQQSQLQEIGVESSYHRQQLMSAIEKLHKHSNIDDDREPERHFLREPEAVKPGEASIASSQLLLAAASFEPRMAGGIIERELSSSDSGPHETEGVQPTTTTTTAGESDASSDSDDSFLNENPTEQ